MLEICDVVQGTEEWRRARAGVPTASEFSTVMATKGRGEGGISAGRRKYMLRLAGEIITGEPMESFSNGYLERGKTMEPEARNYYAFMTGEEPKLIGFMRDTKKRCGCSPDSLIGEDGLLEIKTHAPDILAEMLFKDEFPPEHRAQTQGQLYVSDREWIELICYWPKMPPFIKWACRDEPYIRQIAEAVNRFNDELDDVVARLRSYGGEMANAA